MLLLGEEKSENRAIAFESIVKMVFGYDKVLS